MITNNGEQRILDKLDELESRVGQLQVDVARIEERTAARPAGSALTTGGITVSAATLGGAILWALQQWASK